MEIKAKCRYDYQSIKTVTLATMYRWIRPRFAFVSMMVLCFYILLSEIFQGVFWGINAMDFEFLVIAIALIGVQCFLYFGFPRIQYKALGKLKDAENEYVFYDDIMKVTSKTEEYSGETEIKYSIIPKIMETSKYLLIFQTKNQVYIVDKSTITNGTVDDIREKLKSYVKKKYKIRKF